MRTTAYLLIAFYMAQIVFAEPDGVKKDKDGKILSVFQVISFPNDMCVGSTKNGTCYTSEECSNKGGTSDGSCANGYGVCCIFSLKCGGKASENCTYFESSGTASAGACKAQICPCNTNICQMRLDFDTFVITGPNTVTLSAIKILNGAVNQQGGGEATEATRCLTDTFSVTNSNNNNPVICGTNTGEHMYIEASDNCNDLVFQLGNQAVGVSTAAMRSWTIKVTQYSCNSRMLAPDGCTQYFFGSDTGIVRSYNFANGAGAHLANQNQVICVRRERGNCRICWSTANVDDFAVSNMAATGKIKTCCSYGADGKKSNFDCVQIPSATKEADSANILGNGFCGEKGLVSATGADSKTICSRAMPFQLKFRTDNFEEFMEGKMVAVPEKGFQIAFIMSATKCT